MKSTEEIKEIIERRQLLASKDWKALGEKLSGCTIEAFDIKKYQQEYVDAENNEKNQTYLGRFITAALAQKSMVTNSMAASRNRLAGIGLEVRIRDKG